MMAAEEAEVRDRRKKTEGDPDQAAARVSGPGGDVARGPPLTGTSYWLDLWVMILFDFVLFVFVYLLP